jgi:hypothetical protein
LERDPVVGLLPDRDRQRVWPLLVVGAGAAGCLAGIFAGRAGLPVLLLETRPRPGAKIRVSGGGRCNVLPSEVVESDFHTRGSIHAVRHLLASWPLPEVIAFFERDLGLPLALEPSTGKLFPASDDARDVVAALLRALAAVGATILGGQRTESIELLPPSELPARFMVRTREGLSLRARNVLLATGGRSLPKTGSDGFGFELAQRLGHGVHPTYPALVPLVTQDSLWASLAGISWRVRLRVKHGHRLVEERTNDFLFTHRGFSGPAVLDVSWRFAQPDQPGLTLHVEWKGTSGRPWGELLGAGGARSLAAILAEELPRRLALDVLRRAQVDPSRQLAQLTRGERSRALAHLDDCPLSVSGTEGYEKAEVTGGGVPLDELVLKSLASRRVPGLYLAGEIIDVNGRLGGFNFLWAWISGRKVGEAVGAGAASDGRN